MRMNACKFFLMVSAWIATAGVQAQSVMPGSYVTERSWGTLSVGKPDAKGSVRFKIDAIGGNNHTCQLEGTLRGTRGKAESANLADPNCVVDIRPKDGWLQVSVPETATEACRAFCGARAQFEGEYFAEVAACRAAEIRKSRNQFSQRYKAKDYQNAVATLGLLMEECGQFLDLRDQAEVRNDMAVTYKNMNEIGACLEVLKPLKKDFIDPPGTAFSPADQGWGERMVSASRFNWKTCGGGK